MKEFIDDEMICPHCEHIERDAWEFDKDDGKAFCGHCEKEFNYSRSRTTTYTTWSESGEDADTGSGNGDL